MFNTTYSTKKEKRMTKQEALEICIKMWDWLAENPYFSKSEAIHALNLDIRIIETAECAACYYASQQKSTATTVKYINDCAYCPIWTKAKSCAYHGCLSYDSPFKEWNGAISSSVRTKAAKEVAAMTRKELSKLLKKKEADKVRRSTK